MPDEKYRKIFSNRLNHYMRERGKIQQDLIDDLGLSSATISSWVNGKRLPRMGKIQMLADYLKIDTTDLLEKKEESQLDNISSSLLSKFHQLSPANQTTILSMIDVLLSQQDSSKETVICG